jgi:hypothetical protein
MSNIQSPPADHSGKTDPINCAGLTSPVGRAVFIIDIEFPASFGATQQSVEAEMSCG